MWNWLQRRPVSPLVADYRRHTPRRVDRQREWHTLDYVALDAETTGFSVDHDRILSIGLVPIRQGQIEVAQRRSWLVKQADVPNNEAVKIHGISPAESALGRPEKEVLEELLKLLTGTVIVGHHIGFDVTMINHALQRHFHAKLCNPSVDTAMMAARHIDAFHKTGYPGQRPPTLEELCSHADLPIMGRHTATGDAFTTAQLFLWFCSRFHIRHHKTLRAADLFR
jgi:DNA polymerase-3 subunit epsilon